MESLRIQPPDERNTYIPYKVNLRRKAKVPVLLINATCLNSGHRFVFASDAIPPPENILPGQKTYSLVAELLTRNVAYLILCR